jgi:hypothetical protein
MDIWLAVLLGVAALALGAVLGAIGVGVEPQGRLRQLLYQAGRAILPVAAVALASVPVVILVYFAARDDGSQEAWGYVISAVALLAATALVYGSGPRTYTARQEFSHTPTDGTARTFAVGDPLTKEEYDALPDEHKGRVHSQRGLYFRALYIGADGRWSTSKLQVLLWTYAILYALVALFVASRLGLRLGENRDQTFGDLSFHEEYLLLLGGPFAAAVVAKGLTDAKVENGQVTKPPTDPQKAPGEGLREVVSNDSGETDLVDFQYFFFNLVALTVFLVVLFSDLQDGLPDLPTFLVALTSGAALTYMGKKAVERSTPQISTVIPSRVRPGEIVAVEGVHLLITPTEVPTVTADGLPAAKVEIKRAPRRSGDTAVLSATLPENLPIGDDKKLVVTPRGATTAAEALLDVYEASITGIEPTAALPWRPNAHLTVNGLGFGPKPAEDKATITLGENKLIIEEWRDDHILLKLPSDLQPASPPPELTLTINRDGQPPRTRVVKVSVPAIRVDSVEPTTLTLLPGAPLTIKGNGFGATPPAGPYSVTLGSLPLDIVDWKEERIVATLPRPLTLDSATASSSTLGLEVKRESASGAWPVPVALPEIQVSDVSPLPLPLAPGGLVTVTGTGFGLPGEPDPRLMVGPLTLKLVDGRSDSVLIGELPPEAAPTAEASARLVVERTGWRPGVKSIAVKPAV